MTVTLPIEARVTTKQGVIDLKNHIPGIVYGPQQTPVPIVVNRKEFEKIFKVAGESTVIELSGLPKPVSVLVKDVSFAPTKGGIVHVDFYALEKGKEIVTHVPLHFVGEAPVTKLGGVVNKVLHEVTVSCQATDLPAHIDVDLSSLANAEARLTIADIATPSGVRIVGLAEEVVAVIEMITEEPEATSLTASEAVTGVDSKGKDEAGA